MHKNLRNCFVPIFALMLLIVSCNPGAPVENLQQVNLVSNNGGNGAVTVDPDFINPWGYDFSPLGPAFIGVNAIGTSEVYGPAGDLRRTPILIPGPGEAPLAGAPAAVIFNGTDNFQLQTNFNPARFIYSGTDGIISAWNEGDAAVVVINNSDNASYTGLTIANDGGANLLYAANFKEGRVDVWDGSFNEVSRPFSDPSLPAGYAPYNIKNIDGRIFVTYAKVGTNGEAETGAGKGYINVFNTNGTFSLRFASGGRLNAPWGIAKASTSFLNTNANSAQAILIGNYGDGRIYSYSPAGNYQGGLLGSVGAISIPGLRSLGFAADSVVAEQGKLFFTAGPNGGQDGLFGYLVAIEP